MVKQESHDAALESEVLLGKAASKAINNMKIVMKQRSDRVVQSSKPAHQSAVVKSRLTTSRTISKKKEKNDQPPRPNNSSDPHS